MFTDRIGPEQLTALAADLGRALSG